MNKITRTTGAVALVLATGALTVAATTARAATAARYTAPAAVAVPAVTPDSATVTWATPAADKGARFEVLAYSANDPALGAYAHLSGITGTSAVVKGLPAGTAIDVKVVASADASHAASGWTAPVLVFTTATGSKDGATGPAGPAGPKGADGKDGTVGDVLHNSSTPVTIPAGGEVQAYATCAADTVHGLAPNGTADGYVAVGGGYVIDGGSTGADKVTVTIDRDELTNTAGRGWLVQARNDDTAAHTVAAWVICVDAPADQAAT